MPILPSNSLNLLVRVASDSEDAWTGLVQEIERLSGDTNFEVVDDPRLDGLSTGDFLDLLVDSENDYAFVADAETLANDERSLLAISSSGDTLRIVPASLAGVADNLAIANLSLGDFKNAADSDGVYRGGSRSYVPPETLTKDELLALAEGNTSSPALAQFRDELASLLAPRYAVRRIDLTESHERQAGRDFRGWQTLGHEDYLAVTSHGGEAEYATVGLSRGYWEVLLDRTAGRCLAALKVFPPSNS
ncbi:hypothetical protein [Gordonia sp. NPDC003585]|uniref:DUF6924 domain-containing protein n=1 Tax=unclassified Gordonia (in: high G+C Gram-positive bacteria) TaxID=2657482 RepID=UPI0033B2D71A